MKIPKRKGVIARPIGDRLLNLPEAAEVLRLNPRTVRGYVRRGEIEARIIEQIDAALQACQKLPEIIR